ncbi:MAG: 54S ribosomal protein L2 mitochondrial [Thelocarpon impressellum]|nr:MAG: 54S ribosomal protein L2 mitochondrial [Thelocarpon impressellum]
MPLPRLRLPCPALLSSVSRPSNPSSSSAAASPSHIVSRTATHKAQGSTNSAKDGPGKRLGAKKSGEQQVLPSQIIFRQRGTHWHAGENAGLGRDHTIYALQPGFVKYYRDPARHPKRKYIGVVFERHHVLPTPPGAARRRRLGLVPVPLEHSPPPPSATSSVPSQSKKSLIKNDRRAHAELRPGNMYREPNWSIGRVAERTGAAARVRAFKPRDRFAAWRKTTARRARGAERRGLGGKKRGG